MALSQAGSRAAACSKMATTAKSGIASLPTGYDMTSLRQSPGSSPRSIGALFAQQVRDLGHRPYLTFYDDESGERTELSYATFDNWASKAANLLAEELHAGPGSRIGLLVDAHWTAAVLAVAAWKIGAVVVLEDVVPPAVDVLFVPEAVAADHEGHKGLLVQGAGMGGRLTTAAPGLGFGDEVLAFADDYDDPSVGLDLPALAAGDGDATQGGLLLTAEGLAGAHDRLLATAGLANGVIAGVLLAPALAGASVVWCPRSTHDLQDRITAERVTGTLAQDGSSVTPV